MKLLRADRSTSRILVYATLGAGAILMISPFPWVLLTSFKSAKESIQIPPTTPPKHQLIDNYDQALEALPFVKLYLNTTLLVLSHVLCATTFSSAAGFAFARLNPKDRGLLFSLVIVQIMLPSQIFTIPQCQMLTKFGLTNSLFTLISPDIISAFDTLFLRQACIGIPDELGETTYLDGCTRWQTSTKVMMPLTKASMAALTVFAAISVYVDLVWPLVTNTDLNKMTLSTGLSTLRGQSTTNYPILMADFMLAVIPMVILYVVFQK